MVPPVPIQDKPEISVRKLSRIPLHLRLKRHSKSRWTLTNDRSQILGVTLRQRSWYCSQEGSPSSHLWYCALLSIPITRFPRDLMSIEAKVADNIPAFESGVPVEKSTTQVPFDQPALQLAFVCCWHLVLLPRCQLSGAVHPSTHVGPGGRGFFSYFQNLFIFIFVRISSSREKRGQKKDTYMIPLFLQRNILLLFFSFPFVLSHKVWPRGRQIIQFRNFFVRNKSLQAWVIHIVISAPFLSILKNLQWILFETSSETAAGICLFSVTAVLI